MLTHDNIATQFALKADSLVTWHFAYVHCTAISFSKLLWYLLVAEACRVHASACFSTLAGMSRRYKWACDIESLEQIADSTSE